MMLALLAGGLAPRAGHPDPQELWHARAAILLVFSAMVSDVFRGLELADCERDHVELVFGTAAPWYMRLHADAPAT